MSAGAGAGRGRSGGGELVPRDMAGEISFLILGSCSYFETDAWGGQGKGKRRRKREEE